METNTEVEAAASRWADGAVVLLFVAFLLAPAFAQRLGLGGAAAVAGEARATAAMPARPETRAQWRRYPRRFDAWFADAFGLRTALLRAHNAILWYGLHESPTDQMVRGEDDWIFFAGDKTFEAHRGALPFTNEELAAWTELLEDRRDLLAAEGIEYVFAVAPDKLGVYPDKAPAWSEPVRASRLEQLAAHVWKHSSVTFLDLGPALRAARQEDREGDYLYYPLGTHWTSRGAFAGYEVLAREIRERVGGPGPLRLQQMKRSPGATDGDSWAGRMYLEPGLEQKNVQFRPQTGLTARMDRVGQGNDARFFGSGIGRPRGLLYHDSFGSWIRPYLAEHFERLDCFAKARFDPAAIEALKVDIVIDLWVERRLNLSSPFQPLLGRASELERRFEASTEVVSNLSFDGQRHGVRPREEAGRREAPMRVTPKGLVLEIRAGTDAFWLPPFETRPGTTPCVLIEVTVRERSQLILTHRTDSDPSYEKHHQVAHPLQPGHNRVRLPLREAGARGPLLLKFGGGAENPTLHRFEVRLLEGGAYDR